MHQAEAKQSTLPFRPHWLDAVFAWLAAWQPYFKDGWGDEALLQAAQNGPLDGAPPKAATPTWGPGRRLRGLWVRDGTFSSPQPGLPAQVATAHVRMLTATAAQADDVCLFLAGAREEGFRLREAIYGPLVRRGIDLLLLENPFSGLRRAEGQSSAAVGTVSQHVLLNLAMVQEARALLGWLGQLGYRRRCLGGYSMGGFVAALVASLTQEVLAVAALAAGTTPAPVFTQGVLSRSVDFEALGRGHGGPEGGRRRLAALFSLANALQLPPPQRPDAAVVVGCLKDGYVSTADTRALAAHWPGSTLHFLRAGHVSALIQCRKALRSAVAEALGRLAFGPPATRRAG
jgi:hypothetical protein